MIKQLRIEILFTGLLQIISITLLGFMIADKSIEDIFLFLGRIGSGTSIFLYALLVTISFFLGTIFENSVSAFICLKTKRKPDTERIEIWKAKSFFAASFLWVLVILLLLMISQDIESCKAKLAILIIGIILLIETLSSYPYWWYWEKH